MKILLILLITTFCLKSYGRVWTVTGKKVDAEFKGISGNFVKIQKKPNGKIYKIKKSSFSKDDIDYIETLNTQKEKKDSEPHENYKPIEIRKFKSMKYKLIKPIGYDKNLEYPIVISLHGGCPRERLKNKPSPEALVPFGFTEPIKEKYPCFILVPKATQKWWADGSKKSLVAEIIKYVNGSFSEEFKINKNQIYIVGYSDGGTAILHALAWKPNYFAAAIIMSGWLLQNESTKKMVRSKTATWWFAGNADHIARWENTEKVLNAFKKSKGNLKLTVIDKGDHGSPVRVFNESCSGTESKDTTLIATGKETDIETTNPIDWMFKQKLYN